jgi:hypothetical protein
MRSVQRKLFSQGFDGAFSFPTAAPLALLKEPLSESDLKNVAEALRAATMKAGGKIFFECTLPDLSQTAHTFTAAAVANMTMFESQGRVKWQIGKLVWLSKPRLSKPQLSKTQKHDRTS